MFGRFRGKSRPQYQGQAKQPAAPRGGLLGFFTGGFRLFPRAPVYDRSTPPPAATLNAASGEPPIVGDDPISGEEPADGEHETGGEELGPRRMTIIVTPGPGTTANDVAAFFRDRCDIDG